ncbi:hypothetical protein B296_00006855 [Ensete ventricosum]|uniref:Uncharacterized protein n=1 Tax=Ensete ventricosum TaxID=4639 RepID=A0A426ZUW3_ENSVE|nr:hypothetical protein B296_00006855 [Ensete ventricosum]
MLGRSRVGGSRIKRRPRASLPQAANRSCGGSSHAGKRTSRAIEVAQVATSACQRSATRRTRALAVA